MIQPNELRIDNLVLYDNCICRISMINAADIVEVTSLDGQPKLFSTETIIEHILSIELTEDVLLKCGFEIEYTNGGFLKWQKGDFKLLDRRLPHPLNNIHKEYVLYLHQLQNLYFALTNQELEIEL